MEIDVEYVSTLYKDYYYKNIIIIIIYNNMWKVGSCYRLIISDE